MLIRNVHDEPMSPVRAPGVEGASVAEMVGAGDGTTSVLVRSIHVKPGGHTQRHAHDYEHEVFIVGGEGTVLLGGCERPIRTGDVIYVPANHEHQFRAAAPDDPDAIDADAGGLRFLSVMPARAAGAGALGD